MTRHAPKAPCDQDIAEQVLPLFGTINNAQRCLRLNLPYQIANAAFRGQPVTEEVNDAVVIAWRTWKQLYVRGLGVGADLTFCLPGTIDEAYELINDLAEREEAEYKRLKGKLHRLART